MFDEAFIINNLTQFELLSVSTNRVYRFRDGGENYILKVNHLPPDALSPFWSGLHQVFGFSFDAQRAMIERTLAALQNPHIQTAPLAAKSDALRWQVFKEVPGLAYQPDAFPDSDAIGYQLGQFIGYVHSREYDYFGCGKSRFRSGFKEKMLDAMSEMVRQYWPDSPSVKAMLDDIRNCPVSPASYSLIMPDISANQFVFAEHLESVKAVVDFDAYVIGPREWELSVIELCLKNCSAFRRGYELYRPFPDLSAHRAFYRFFMYLCDPWDKQDLADFMSRDIRF